jgi:hypothetical protein
MHHPQAHAPARAVLRAKLAPHGFARVRPWWLRTGLKMALTGPHMQMGREGGSAGHANGMRRGQASTHHPPAPDPVRAALRARPSACTARFSASLRTLVPWWFCVSLKTSARATCYFMLHHTHKLVQLGNLKATAATPYTMNSRDARPYCCNRDGGNCPACSCARTRTAIGVPKVPKVPAVASC